jgi:hypothetical protein
LISWKAADEPLRPHHTDSRSGDVEGRPRALQHHDACVLQHDADLVDAVLMPIVIAEHRDDRNVDLPRSVRENLRLLRPPMRGQIPGEEDDVRLAIEARKGFCDLDARTLFGVHVAGCRYPHTRHAPDCSSDSSPHRMGTGGRRER